MKVLNWIAIILVIIGALNWGLVGLSGMDLVASLFGAGSSLAMLVYVLVGIAGVYTIWLAKKLAM